MLARKYLEDFTFGLRVWVGELNLPVDASRANQRWVKRFDPIGGQNYLDVPTSFESVQLVKQLQHGALDFLLSATCRVVPVRGNKQSYLYEEINKPRPSPAGIRLYPIPQVKHKHTILQT